MTLAQLHTIKQSLDKAYLLLKPKQAAMEAFKANLVYLLQRITKKKENVNSFLEAIWKDTSFEIKYQEPENSSPVCYANIAGLREGFEDPLITELQTPSDLNNNDKTIITSSNRLITSADLKDAVFLTKSGIMAILKHQQNSLQADNTRLKSQINELVYQLFELTPEEIAIVEEG